MFYKEHIYCIEKPFFSSFQPQFKNKTEIYVFIINIISHLSNYLKLILSKLSKSTKGYLQILKSDFESKKLKILLIKIDFFIQDFIKKRRNHSS